MAPDPAFAFVGGPCCPMYEADMSDEMLGDSAWCFRTIRIVFFQHVERIGRRRVRNRGRAGRDDVQRITDRYLCININRQLSIISFTLSKTRKTAVHPFIFFVRFFHQSRSAMVKFQNAVAMLAIQRFLHRNVFP